MTEIRKWFVLYTRSRAEKKVLNELELEGIEAYLPLQRKLRQWSDRKKWVEMPLISGYLFVHINLKEYEKVLKTFGVVGYVRFEGKAAVVPDHQIEYIKKMLHEPGLNIEVSPQLPDKGDQIIVIAGPLIGLRGKLVSLKGKKRVAIEIIQLNLSLLVEVQLSDIEKATE
jgi:transcription antitermination factor NusG